MQNPKIAKRIQDLRIKTNLTKDKIVKLLNLESINDYDMIENNEVVFDAVLLDKIANIYNVSKDYLLLGDFKADANKPQDQTKVVEVNTSFTVYKLVDFIILSVITVIFTLFSLFNGEDIQQYLYATLMVLSIAMVFYYIVIGRMRMITNKDTITISVNERVTYQSSIDEKIFKRSKKDTLLLGILVIILNIFYYSILFTDLLKNNIGLAILVIFTMVIMIALKLYAVIVSFKEITKTRMCMLIVLFVVEIILNSLFLASMTIYHALLFEVALFGGFNLLATLFFYGVINFFLIKHKLNIVEIS